MTLDSAAVHAVIARVLRLRAAPPLFHDVMRPVVIERRLQRLLGWLGESRALSVYDALHRRDRPAPGRGWQRNFGRHHPSKDRAA